MISLLPGRMNSVLSSSKKNGECSLFFLEEWRVFSLLLRRMEDENITLHFVCLGRIRKVFNLSALCSS